MRYSSIRQLLFDLLELEQGGELAMKVWKILDKLPHNEGLTVRLQSLSALGDFNISAAAIDATLFAAGADADADAAPGTTAVDWNDILPPTKLIMMLYTLQVVEKIAIGEGYTRGM